MWVCDPPEGSIRSLPEHIYLYEPRHSSDRPLRHPPTGLKPRRNIIHRMTRPFSYIRIRSSRRLQTTQTITSVVFNTSRYGKYHERIHFAAPVSRAEAIEAVELWMNEPITEEYFAEVADDLYRRDRDFANCGLTLRGHCLGEARYIEILSVKNGVLTITCGS